MSNRTHSQGKVGHMGALRRALAAVFASALVFAAAVACAAQTQSADGTRASEKKATVAASSDKYEAHTDAPKGAPAAAPKVGEAAPDFKLPYATQEKLFMKPEEQMSLSSLRGKSVILAFYPADWSGGCTTEVCTLRDTFAELSKLNATVLGISGDYVFSHQEWAKFHKLQFPLLSDHDHHVAKAYDSYMEQYGFNKRTIYLIDKDGVVRYVNLAFKAGDKKDYDALRAELEKLK
ncbi:MAG: glutaredoxin-dependent peroxiredoxin [Acidobacteriota bacterium]|nr:glutaredoxin-dependent peroxiredoxin [Acidobacteriota bacterium]